MAGKPGSTTFTVRSMPWRDSLLTAGQQATIAETGLWQAKNVTVDIDGMLMKRPGLRQWGQTIKQPDTGATGSTLTFNTTFLNGLNDYGETDSSSGKITTATRQGLLRTNVQSSNGGETYTLSKNSTLSGNDEWSMRLMFRGTNLQAYTPAGTTANTFAIKAQGAAGSGKLFAIWSGGLYYQKDADDTFELVSGTSSIGGGGWVCIEIRCDDDSGNTTVYLNDSLVDTISSALIKDQTITGAAYELVWTVEGSGDSSKQYSTQLASVMYNDTISDPFEAQEIVAVTDFQYLTRANSLKRCLLCAAGEYIYHDNSLAGAWRPLLRKQYSTVFFAHYRRTMAWVDTNNASSGTVWTWNGYDDPEQMKDSPNLRFIAEHQQRLWGAGDRTNPLRVYYSGDRQPDVWYSPAPDNIEDEFDVALDAGYIDIPSQRGDEVTAIYGDYYDSIIVFTRRSVWRITGFGVNSFQRTNIRQGIGCISPLCVTPVGNDLWFLGEQGIMSIATTEQFGDLRTQFISGPIQDLWGLSVAADTTLVRDFLAKSKLVYDPQQTLVYAAVPITGDTNSDHIYAARPYPDGRADWYGPWDIEARALASGEIAAPVINIVLHGDSSGRIGYTDHLDNADFSTGTVEMLLESAMINGRSLDPRLAGQRKTFSRLRIYFLPRGEYDYTVTYRTDTREEGSQTANQLDLYSEYVITKDFKLDKPGEGVLRSSQEMAMREFKLDLPGYAFAFKLEQTGLGQDMPIQGWELDFTATGFEESYANN